MTETISELPSEFIKALESEKIIFGTKSVLQAVKLGTAEKVIFASNMSKNLVDDLEHYAKLSNTKLEKFKGTNEELGVKCKRAHSVLAVALLKSK